MHAVRAILLLLAALVAIGCGESEVPTSTQVTLRIQGLEHPSFARMTHLQIAVFRKDATWVPASAVRMSKEQLRVPLDLPILPASALALQAPFEVVVDALDGTTRIAQARAVSSYAPNSLRVLEIRLHDCGGRSSSCMDDDCHGPTCATCGLNGTCAEVGFTPGDSLPAFDPGLRPGVKPPGTGESSEEALARNDGGMIGSTAGLDAGRCVGADCTAPAPATTTPPPAEATCPNCASPGFCMRSAAGASCVCPAGWMLTATGCSPPAGCNGFSCPAHASCTVSAQTPSCACDPGYTKTGSECVPVDECTTGAHACGPGTCVNGAGPGYGCACPMGYQASADSFPSCALIDECKSAVDPCGANGTCSAGAGVGYACNCKQNYVSDGKMFASCIPEDECATGTHACTSNGTCTNGAGVGYQCTCRQGYRSSGGMFPRCETEDECATGTHGCSPGGTCSNGAGVGYMCTCNQGYVSSGGSAPKCNPVDECSTNTHWCAPSAGSCSNGAGVGYSCLCPSGFSNSGGTIPQCYRSGTLTASLAGSSATNPGATLDFYPTPRTAPCCSDGEFYVISGADAQLWSNNVGQRGVVRATAPAGTRLLDVPVPTSGYTRFGVPIAVGGTYVSYAQEADGPYYVIFRVNQFSSAEISVEYVYVYRP